MFPITSWNWIIWLFSSSFFYTWKSKAFFFFLHILSILRGFVFRGRIGFPEFQMWDQRMISLWVRHWEAAEARRSTARSRGPGAINTLHIYWHTAGKNHILLQRPKFTIIKHIAPKGLRIPSRHSQHIKKKDHFSNKTHFVQTSTLVGLIYGHASEQ